MCSAKTTSLFVCTYVFWGIEGGAGECICTHTNTEFIFCVTVHLCIVLKCSGNTVLCWQLHSSGERINIHVGLAKRRHFDVALCVLYLLSGNLASLSCLLPLPALPWLSLSVWYVCLSVMSVCMPFLTIWLCKRLHSLSPPCSSWLASPFQLIYICQKLIGILVCC